MNFKKRTFRWCFILTFILLSSGIPQKSYGQLNPIPYVDSQLRAWFAPLWHPTPEPNHLFEMSVKTLDSTYFGYMCPDTLEADMWYKIYEEMRTCAYDTTLLDPPADIYTDALQFMSDTIVVNILALDYNTFIDSALTTDYYFDWDTATQTITEKGFPGELNPYNTGKVFAACPRTYLISDLQTKFRFDPTFIFHDNANDFIANNWRIEVDLGDGAGWHNIPLGAPYHVQSNYSTSGRYTITTRVLDMANNVIMKSISAIQVMKPQYRIAPDSTFETDQLVVGIYKPCETSGDALEKTIIYLEGIDLGDKNPATNRGASRIYGTQIFASGLADLQNYGYTFVVVDWKNSRQDIRTNAVAVADLLSQLKCAQPDPDNPTSEFIIIGESMGGLVARNAMCLMEQYPSFRSWWCQQSKMHNTRLLITVDAPHEGANIPLGYQHLYRMAKPFLGIFASGISQQQDLAMLDGSLDEMATKQMLLYHQSTFAPFGNPSHTPHSEYTSFFHDLDSLGDYPQYCKIVALSNGSLTGRKQTRFYDGEERNPNDTLLSLVSDAYANFLWWRNLHMWKVDAMVKTTPDGNGRLMRTAISRNFYIPRFSIKIIWPCLFCLPKIKVSFSLTTSVTLSLGQVDGKGLKPYDVMPGSTQALVNEDDVSSTVTRALFGNSKPTYQGGGVWSNSGKVGLGNWINFTNTTTLRTNGMNYNFIPVFSALSYPIGLDYYKNLETTLISTKVAATPFDVISAIPENYSEAVDIDNLNLFKYNRDHIHVRNEALGKYYDGTELARSYWQSYPPCGTTAASITRMLNREIGDDTLLLENRAVAWNSIIDVYKYMGINQRSDLYEYPMHISNRMFPGVYSKENGYVINSGVVSTFMVAIDSNNVVYNSPPSHSQYIIDIIDWERCCEEFAWSGLKTAPEAVNNETPGIKTIDARRSNDVKVYPNPASGNSFIVEFDAVADTNSRIGLYDVTGRRIHQQYFSVNVASPSFKLPVQANDALPPGNYFILLENGGSQYKKTIIISRN
jgi:pimeloyl-ACP methyl ester carboxylesterase